MAKKAKEQEPSVTLLDKLRHLYLNLKVTTTYIRSGGARNVRGILPIITYTGTVARNCERVTFSNFRYERIGMSLAEVYEVYERDGESVSVCKRPNRATTCISWL